MKDNIKILILEDNESDVDLMLYELRKNGLIIIFEVVDNRKAFEDALLRFMPNIILSDYSLPSFTGIEAFKIAQRKFPNIPFIIVSGTIGDERAVELIKSGVTDYALKEKLFTLSPKISRALRDAEEKHEKKIGAEELKIQNEKLLEIAVMQSHQVRLPVANILGLLTLLDFDNPTDPDNATVLALLKESAEGLDKIIHEIVKKTNSI